LHPANNLNALHNFKEGDDMNLKLRLLKVVPVALAACAVLIAAGCKNHYGEDGKPAEDKITAGTNTRSLAAAGSTFIEPLIDRWDSDYGKSHSLHINYLPVGSGAGIDRLRQGYGAFSVSDAPLGDDQLQGLPPIVQFPVTAGPVCVIYNLPGLKTPLKLSGSTLARIYAGEVATWQDPAIAHENPGVALPHAPVIVVHRSDGSGTTSIFTNYLSKASATWMTKSGAGLSVKWPTGLGENGSNAVLSTVATNIGAVGYLELSYAKKAGMPFASIQNRAGEFVVPSPASASLAVNAAIDILAKDIRTPIVDPPATAKGAYSITGLSFILIPKDNKNGLDGDQVALKDYIAYALTTGQDVAEELSYAKLPPPVQHQGQALLSQLTQNGQALK
jgi:phosphate transport system substrate-binding protein